MRVPKRGGKTRKDHFIPDRFDGQVCFIVGGAQGIGKSIATRLAREGARLVIADVDRPKLAETKAEISAAGGKVRTIPTDVRRAAQVERMVRQVLAWHRRIDVLMYVSGIGKPVPFVETSEAFWDQTMEVNLKGAFLVSRLVAKQMIKQQGGKIVFMASTNSWDGEGLMVPYNASKAGLFLLGKTMARELGPHRINVNCVGPGFIRTRLTAPIMKDRKFMKKYANLLPLGRLGWPEDIAGPATFLASRDADYVTGVLLFVDGGQLA